MARSVPTQDRAREAAERLLRSPETGADIFDALDDIRPLHPKNNTFPGEVFLRPAVSALAEGGGNPDRLIDAQGLVGTHLPECEFRGRDNHKIRYTLLAAAAIHGGARVDLLEEVAYWDSDDFWSYAGLAAVVWIRAVAEERGVSLDMLCRLLRASASHPGAP